MIETEIKIRIRNAAETRKRLLELGCTVSRERFLEINVLYDFPDKRLSSKDEAIRLRIIGRRSWLTFKGAARKARSFKVREEHESEFKKPSELRKILKTIGLQPSFTYRKRRTFLKGGRLKICLDETSIGSFVELEGKRADIVRFAAKMGVHRAEFITLDYVRMMREATEKSSPR